MTEAELFLTSIRNCRRIDLHVDTPPLTPLEKDMFMMMKQRRREGEPLQYILGYTEFYGLKILVDQRVLIPRPETELLTEIVIKIAEKISGQSLRILDVGTGSGNISIALAKNINHSRVTALDISQDALDLARQNAKINSVEERIIFLHSDLFKGISTDIFIDGKFDVIVSNPPYIKSRDLLGLPKDVQQEPRLALDGGIDGLDVYRRLIKEGKFFLRTGGFLIMECGDGQAESIKRILAGHEDFHQVEVRKDFNKRDRVIIAKLA